MTKQEFIAICFTAKTFDFEKDDVKSFELACEANIVKLQEDKPKTSDIKDVDGALD